MLVEHLGIIFKTERLSTYLNSSFPVLHQVVDEDCKQQGGQSCPLRDTAPLNNAVGQSTTDFDLLRPSHQEGPNPSKTYVFVPSKDLILMHNLFCFIARLHRGQPMEQDLCFCAMLTEGLPTVFISLFLFFFFCRKIFNSGLEFINATTFHNLTSLTTLYGKGCIKQLHHYFPSSCISAQTCDVLYVICFNYTLGLN